MECIILGNGPSLTKAILPDLPSFGCNYIGKMLQPTFYVCMDAKVIKHDDVIYPTAKAAVQCFLRDFNSQDAHPHPLYDIPNAVMVKRNSYVFQGESTPTGCTTTFMMLKIAYFMGFDTVYLYGVDHTLEHFTSDWVVGVTPSLEGRIKHYKIAAEMYRKDGKQIVNRSASSILDSIFIRE